MGKTLQSAITMPPRSIDPDSLLDKTFKDSLLSDNTFATAASGLFEREVVFEPNFMEPLLSRCWEKTGPYSRSSLLQVLPLLEGQQTDSSVLAWKAFLWLGKDLPSVLNYERELFSNPAPSDLTKPISLGPALPDLTPEWQQSWLNKARGVLLAGPNSLLEMLESIDLGPPNAGCWNDFGKGVALRSIRSSLEIMAATEMLERRATAIGPETAFADPDLTMSLHNRIQDSFISMLVRISLNESAGR